METLVMIPTYNERENIPKLVSAVMKMKNIGAVIVDDSSPDGTGEVADGLSKRYRGRVFVLHRTERGRGTAGIAGFKKCLEIGSKYVIEMDADFSHDPKYIHPFLEQMKSCDVVIGSRFVKGGKDVNRKIGRMLVSKLARIVYVLGLRTGIKDVASGFKCYKSSVLRAVDLDNFVSKGFTISMELNYKIAKKGFHIREYPIEFADRRKGESKLSMDDFLETLVLVLKLNLKRIL
jgi:dolichol-phosphate mannosyltransferase